MVTVPLAGGLYRASTLGGVSRSSRIWGKYAVSSFWIPLLVQAAHRMGQYHIGVVGDPR